MQAVPSGASLKPGMRVDVALEGAPVGIGMRVVRVHDLLPALVAQQESGTAGLLGQVIESLRPGVRQAA